MRHRSDLNQPDIITALKKIGATVYVIGRPVDLLVGYRSHNFLLEVKNLGGKNKKTDFQDKFIKEWKGQVRICHSAEEAIELVTKSY